MTVMDVARRLRGVDAMDDMVRAKRRGLARVAIGCPASLLDRHDIAEWSRESGSFVNARSIDELDLAASAGIRPNQLILHVQDCSPDPIRHAVGLGVRRFVVGTPEEARALARHTHRPTFALLNLHGEELIPTMAAILVQHRITVIGAHTDLDQEASSEQDVARDVDRMMVHCATIRTRFGILLSRISLSGGSLDAWLTDPEAARQGASAVDDALEQACLRHRVPRPNVALAPAC